MRLNYSTKNFINISSSYDNAGIVVHINLNINMIIQFKLVKNRNFKT